MKTHLWKLLLVITLLALAPAPGRAEDPAPGSEVLLVRFAAMVGSRSPLATPIPGVSVSGDPLADVISDWDADRDNEEIKSLLALRDLGEVVRQAAPLPVSGGSLAATFFLHDDTYEVDIQVTPRKRDPDEVVADIQLFRNRELVSNPQIGARLGQRAVLTMGDPERPLFLFYVFEARRVQERLLREQGVRGAWSGAERSGAAMAPARPVWGREASYTDEALAAKVHGVVTLQVHVGADGRPGAIEVKHGLPAGLTESAITAVREMRFEPATLEGKPVASELTLNIGFRLPETAGEGPGKPGTP
jgi:TonB family protein